MTDGSVVEREAHKKLRPAALVYAVIAALAMVATLPGRTHGIGLITEPLLADFEMPRVAFAALNFWATLIGATFCLPVGWLIDRIGVNYVLFATLLSLGVVVIAMTKIRPGCYLCSLLTPEFFFVGGLEYSVVPLDLFLLVLFTRGLGQSALSVVSLSLIGKKSGNRPGIVIGLYSFFVAIGFMVAFAGIKVAFEIFESDWRTVWALIGWTLIVSSLMVMLFLRNPTTSISKEETPQENRPQIFTLGAALITPGFWIFCLATSFYGLVASGMSLFNQSLLAERGFDRGVFLTITIVAPLIGLTANLVSGWLATKIRLGILLASGLIIQMFSLACFPMLETLVQVYAYAVAMGVAGGILTVVFFTVWRQAFGTAHLGKIQGTAQLVTVLASAIGPLVLAAGHRATGSYAPVVQNLAVVAGCFAIAAFVVPLPSTQYLQKENLA